MTRNKLFGGMTILLMVTLACGLTDTISSGAQQVATLAGDVENLAGDVQALATTAANAIPQAALDDPRAYLIDAVTHQMLSEAYRASINFVTPDQVQDYTVEFQPPDRFHLLMPGVVESIVVGDQFYLKQGDTWSQAPLSDELMGTYGLLGPDIEHMLDTIQNVQFAGMELLNGTPALIFTYSREATIGDVMATSTDKLWLGATDGRVYKVVMEGEAAGAQTTTTIIYTYDPSITVESPV